MKLSLGLDNNSEPKRVKTERSPYPIPLATIRKKEYPSLQATTYLDHTGTTPPPQTAINAFAKDMNSHLFGNPHSASPSSMLSTERMDCVRQKMLAFFKADPAYFDLVFVANTTAAVKLVIDCMADYGLEQNGGRNDTAFWYGYHRDCHTSLVGPREVASMSRYFREDAEVEQWLSSPRNEDEAKVGIFAYPAQSNMNGRRLPLTWPGRLRTSRHSVHQNVYSLLDAAAYVATAQLDLSNVEVAPDFTALSFYKIFGFPDLGALIVRKDTGHVLSRRRYIGGGTVDMVINDHEPAMAWHSRKQTSLHDMLEEGTPAFHSITALESALEIHGKLYGSMTKVSQHTSGLAMVLYKEMATLTYANGESVCNIYKDPSSIYGCSQTQGPTVSFNIKDSSGRWIGKTQFERAAIAANIHLRTGGVCNPGGIASALDWTSKQMKANHAAGVSCGNDVDEIHGKPTGIVRVSLGAMSSLEDIKRFLEFLRRFAETQGQRKLWLGPAPKPSVDDFPESAVLFSQDSSEWARFASGLRPANSCVTQFAKVDTQASVSREQISLSPTLNDRTQDAALPRWQGNSNKAQQRRGLCPIGGRQKTKDTTSDLNRKLAPRRLRWRA